MKLSINFQLSSNLHANTTASWGFPANTDFNASPIKSNHFWILKALMQKNVYFENPYDIAIKRFFQNIFSIFKTFSGGVAKTIVI